MLERELENLFIQFLLQRGYHKENLLSQFSIRTKNERLFGPDLVILDTFYKEYIGLIEFKNRIDSNIEEITLGQFYKYFGSLGTRNIPAYLVIPILEDDFQIFELTTDNLFRPISKEDFPNFETLSAKKATEEKIKRRELELNKLKEIEDKQRRTKLSAYLAILSLLAGISASIFALFLQQKGIDKPTYQPFLCCDSLDSKFYNLQQRIISLEKQLNLIDKSKKKVDTLYIGSNISALEKRIKTIELGISNNPEKTLSVMTIKQEIELLKKADEYSKELTQSKFEALKNQIETQNTWVLGILIAIFGTILSFAIPNLLPKHNRSTGTNLKD